MGKWSEGIGASAIGIRAVSRVRIVLRFWCRPTPNDLNDIVFISRFVISVVISHWFFYDDW